MSSFAALYADHVLVHQPFPSTHDHGTTTGEWDRRAVAFGLYKIWSLQPLILSGIASFVSSNLSFCADCYRTVAAQVEPIELAIRNASDSNLSILAEHLSGSIQRSPLPDSKYAITIRGADAYVEHGALVSRFDKLPKSLRLGRTGTRALSGPDLVKFGFMHRLVNPCIDDLLHFQILRASNFPRVSLLTGRQSDGDVLRSVKATSTQNPLPVLHHLLPQITGVPLDTIIQLRTELEDNFQEYRYAVSSVVDNISSSNSAEIEYQVDNAIAPSIHKIRTQINNKKSRSRKALATAAISLGSLSVGLATGWIPAEHRDLVIELLGIPALLGVAFGRESESQPEGEPLYFLWRAQQLK